MYEEGFFVSKTTVWNCYGDGLSLYRCCEWFNIRLSKWRSTKPRGYFHIRSAQLFPTVSWNTYYCKPDEKTWLTWCLSVIQGPASGKVLGWPQNNYSIDPVKLLKFRTEQAWDWRLRICKIVEITRKIYSNKERSEQFLVTKCCFNLFLEVSLI